MYKSFLFFGPILNGYTEMVTCAELACTCTPTPSTPPSDPSAPPSSSALGTNRSGFKAG